MMLRCAAQTCRVLVRSKLLGPVEQSLSALQVVSPRNHMVYTPLLTSGLSLAYRPTGCADLRSSLTTSFVKCTPTEAARLSAACVGTLDLRSVAVPIMALQKHLKDAQNNLFLASAQRVDAKQKEVLCKDEDGFEFKIPYDKLVIATGSQVGCSWLCLVKDQKAFYMNLL